MTENWIELRLCFDDYFADLTVITAISGGTLNRNGNMLVPIPVVTKTSNSFAFVCPAE